MQRAVSGPCVPWGSGWGAPHSPIPPRVLVPPSFVTASPCLISPGFILLTDGFYQVGRNVKITAELSPERRAEEGGDCAVLIMLHAPCTRRRLRSTLYLSVSITPAQGERVAQPPSTFDALKGGYAHRQCPFTKRGSEFPKAVPSAFDFWSGPSPHCTSIFPWVSDMAP